MSEEHLEPGHHLGRYTLERTMGHGASGVVYLAHDTTLDTEVAIKVLTLASDDSWARFKREILIARKVQHPGICRIFDLHEEGTTRFITMEYVPGETLEAVLQKAGALPVPRAVGIMRAVLRAIRAAHAAGIVHRDLRPLNIMIGPEDRASILDFGFARARDSQRLTAHGSAFGEPHYLAPELLDGADAAPETDLYAIGAILYRAITGKVPFPGGGLLDVKEAIAAGPAPAPRALNQAVSAALSDVVLKAIGHDPEDRFPSADAFEAALAAQIMMFQVPTQVGEVIRSPLHGNLERTVADLTGLEALSDVIRSRIRPTTILFSDIVGITPYFEKHGDVAGRKLLESHNNLLFPIITDHRGTVVKTIGDAILATFLRAEDGMRAAVEMQRALAMHNERADAAQEIHIRIGLHSGPAIVEQKDVFGDTVNMAARVASKAKGEEILISAACRDLAQSYDGPVRARSTTELKGKTGVFTLFSVEWRTGPTTASGSVLTDTNGQDALLRELGLPEPGVVFAEKYRIDRVIGAGGMGVVVAATHTLLRQVVAIKFMRRNAIASPEAVERFMREARAVIRLRSPHVARVFDLGMVPDGGPYIVMEYLEGEDLAKLVRRDGPLPPELAVDFLLEACDALAEAHRLGVVHRDIKPSNLFFAHEGHGPPVIRVLDFGLSKLATSVGPDSLELTTTQSFVGSPLFMAPEQLTSARNVDHRADLWGLGATLYYLLSGTTPFGAGSVTELAALILRDPPTPLPESLPNGLRDIVAQLLAKDPAARFATADELAQALTHWRHGAAARPENRPALSPTPATAKPVWRFWLVPVTAMLALGLALWLWNRPRSEVEKPTRAETQPAPLGQPTLVEKSEHAVTDPAATISTRSTSTPPQSQVVSTPTPERPTVSPQRTPSPSGKHSPSRPSVKSRAGETPPVKGPAKSTDVFDSRK